MEDNSKINDGPTKSSFLGADSSAVENVSSIWEILFRLLNGFGHQW